MIEAYPLQWPLTKPRTPESKRQTASFGKKETVTGNYGSWKTTKPLTLNQACKRVLSELDKYTRVGQPIRVPESSIVISTNIPVRKDGLPYSNFRKPADPGAAVYFSLDGQQYCLPCDKWDRVEDNIAAIAAHINALRGIERWGVGESHDAYAGFKALPESTAAEKEIWSVLEFDQKPDHVELIHSHYKRRAKVCHPDVPGGSEAAFQELQDAYQKALKFFKP